MSPRFARHALAHAFWANVCAALALVATGLAFGADAVRPDAVRSDAARPDGLRPATVNAKLEARLPGKFIWFDCVTADAYRSKAFYGVVFNWEFHSIGSGSGRYTLIENKGRNIGGMHFRPQAKSGGFRSPALVFGIAFQRDGFNVAPYEISALEALHLAAPEAPPARTNASCPFHHPCRRTRGGQGRRACRPHFLFPRFHLERYAESFPRTPRNAA